MPQLSILIPFDGNDKQLESTLVSVLENRPYQCEVIVAHPGNYADPYDLGDEVRFVEFSKDGFEWGQVVSTISSEIDAPILHILGCGTIVTQGWTQQVNEAFDDPYVGSACPILLCEDQSVFCVGVENTALYRNRLLAAGKRLVPQDYQTIEPVGPLQLAAFYRTEALREVTCLPELSDHLFGLELALSLEAIGYENTVLDSSIIQIDQEAINRFRAAENPSDSQKAIWRFAGSLGTLNGLALTLMGASVDLLGSPFSSRRRASLAARITNWVDFGCAGRFRDFVDQAEGPVSGSTIPMQSHDLSLTGSELQMERRAA